MHESGHISTRLCRVLPVRLARLLRKPALASALLAVVGCVANAPARGESVRPGTNEHRSAAPTLAHPAAKFPSSPVIPAAEIRADFAEWMHQMHDLNPDIALRTDLARYDAERREIEHHITGPMTQLEVWGLFARLNPTFNDGHNGILMPDQYSWVQHYLDAGGTLLPLSVHVDGRNRVFVTSTLRGESQVVPHDRITAINGRPTEEIVHAMLARAHGDTERFRRELVSRRFGFLYLLLYGDTDSYRIDARTPEGVVKYTTVKGISEMPEQSRPNAPASTHFHSAVLPDGVGYLKAGTFDYRYAKSFHAFADTAFTRFRAANVKAVIIDIRDNGGGDDPLWQDELMQNVTSKPYRQISHVVIRVTKQNADSGDVIGSVQSKDYKKSIKPTPENPIRFNGPVYILIGPYTYSSAIVFATSAQDNGIAEIAGEETGGYACQTGRVTEMKMERTKLDAFTPIFVLTRPSGAGCRMGVVPDIPLRIDPFDPGAVIHDLAAMAAARADARASAVGAAHTGRD